MLFQSEKYKHKPNVESVQAKQRERSGIFRKPFAPVATDFTTVSEESGGLDDGERESAERASWVGEWENSTRGC